MGFLKKFQIGKVAGAVVRGFSQGGFYGAVLEGGTAAAVASVKAGTAKAANYGGNVARVTPVGSTGMYSGAAALLPGYGITAGSGPASNPDVVLASNRSVAKIPQDVAGYLTALVTRLGLPAGTKVVPAAKRVLAKVIMAARRIPGMTPIGMLVGLGLSEMAAQSVLTWYTTSGKRRRRMRVTNVKALTRSARRLEGFHKLARRVEAALGRRSGVVHHRRTPKRLLKAC